MSARDFAGEFKLGGCDEDDDSAEPSACAAGEAAASLRYGEGEGGVGDSGCFGEVVVEVP